MGDGAMREGARPPAPDENIRIPDDPVKVLFPFEEVSLFSGERVIVRPWTLETGPIQTARLLRLHSLLESGPGSWDWSDERNAANLAQLYSRECQAIVADTVGWTHAQLQERVHTFEELLRLFGAVWRVCIARGDGGGVGPELARLIGGAGGTLVGLIRAPSRARSTPSSAPATPSPTSAH
jgi:hypothetical protein